VKDSDPRIKFLIALGRALHSYGIPAHRLEDALGNAATRLGITAEFFSGPTSLIASFGEPGNQQTSMSRVSPGNLQLDKLVELDEVVEALYRSEMSVEEARTRLVEVDSSPQRYGPVLTTLAFGLASGLAARFFGGGLNEMMATFGLGLLTGLLALAAERFVVVGRIFEFAVSFLVTFLVLALSVAGIPLATNVIILASLIIILPGLTLTLALNELATGHLVSGTARLSGALMTFMKLGLGVGLAQRLADFLPGALVEVAPVPLPAWTLWVALVITPVALAILFRARSQEVLWILVAAMVAFWGARYGVEFLGPGLGAAVGALLAGLTSNLFARLKHRPAVVLVVPSLILLVPGSLGYRSMSMLMGSDILTGMDTAFTALLVGVSLVAGLLLANVMLPPKNAL
jgi:uncharacterized membrane protein YjjP (DUF1212 family)